MAVGAEIESNLVFELQNEYSDSVATAFVRQYQKFVFALAYRQLQDYDDADDATQETFIRALKSISNFKGDSSLQTWLYRITVNVCHTARRKKKLRSFFSFGNEEFEKEQSNAMLPDQQVENTEFTTQFFQLLEQLPDKQRETFCLRYFDELSYEEISEMLGTSIGGLKANYFQATKKLAILLKETNLLRGENEEELQ